MTSCRTGPSRAVGSAFNSRARGPGSIIVIASGSVSKASSL